MSSEQPSGSSSGLRIAKAAQVIVVSSVMFTFISYWRTAAVVLCDLASTAYYIGGIVEASIGAAAPWFILAVMLFSYAVRSVYIESCSLFVRGGVYRVVKEAMGGFLAKLSVSALMFDYILTGPISGVSAGQYLIGLGIDTWKIFHPDDVIQDDLKTHITNWGSVVIAVGITLYFFRQNLIGIHESSEKALKIMMATTVMAVIIMVWSGITIGARLAYPEYGPLNPVPMIPDLRPKVELDENGQVKLDENGKIVPKLNPITKQQEDPRGFLPHLNVTKDIADGLDQPKGNIDWLSLIGMIGIGIGFSHSILAMSGEETLAQVYREVEAPKMKNFKKAAFIVFIYSLVLTAGISFLAVILIPEKDRVGDYSSNLISGLAMNMVGYKWMLLLLNAFVVIIGFLILAGAVNTAIIGSNGVLNRVAEDGVMPEWCQKPHPHYGTTYRILYIILGMQLFTIVFSQGDVLLLGEAYAFGVVWSFVFKAMAMLVLRFTEPGGREYKVPLNIPIGKTELPVGLALIFIVLFISAILNLLTKETATIWGLGFTLVFLMIFMISEHYHERNRDGTIKHAHLDHFNRQVTETITPAGLGLKKQYRKLVSIRSPQNLFMLEKALAETDPDTTEVIVMTAKMGHSFDPIDSSLAENLDNYDQQLMTAVVERAEKAGKEIKPIIVPTNNPLNAILQTTKDLQAQELIMGASNKFTAEEQLDQISFYWITLHGGNPTPLTVRVLNRQRDVSFDLEGGNRIPKISERKARSMAELRAAGVGVNRVLLAHDGSPMAGDLFEAVWTMLDPHVVLDFATINLEENSIVQVRRDQDRAHHLGREVNLHPLGNEWGADLVRICREGSYDLIVLPLIPRGSDFHEPWEKTSEYVLANAPCPVSLIAQPLIPKEVSET